jgi:two-component system phosphate regulon sensor histidine kinase PhoR
VPFQKNELEAVLSGLVQGVLVVDGSHQVISINDAAARLLEVIREQVLGKHIAQVIGNDDLRRVVLEALRSEDPVEGHVVLRKEQSPGQEDATVRFVRVQDTKLFDADGRHIGKMIALQDVTHLRRLEAMRRDFVANVSHEIKTPVTAIKAAAEMLLDDQGHAPEDRVHFLQIIARQGDRLHAIVEDLLVLARIEQDAEQHQIALEPGRIGAVLDAAVEACLAHAGGTRIELHCDTDLIVPINQHLLEQAVINLLGNAIKYSQAGSAVRISADLRGDEVVIAVQDKGVGIAREHLPRIFERFYRTDKARSRELGGTGLGLAIVKHVAQAHGGRAVVQSEIGVGSTFCIHLRAKPIDPQHPE